MGAEKIGRQLQREEAVHAVRVAHGPERAALGSVDGELVRAEDALCVPVLQRAAPREVQANLEAAGVEAASPVHVVLHVEIMPLHAEALVKKAAVERVPGALDVPPGAGLADFRNLLRVFGNLGLDGFQSGVRTGGYNLHKRCFAP